jgi:hypothetical protein
MRTMLTVALVLAGCCLARAQEPLPRDEALKAAFQLCHDLSKMLDTPIATDPDVKRPVGIRADDRGLMVLPESKLSLDVFAKAGADVAPVGQLWLLKAVPVVEGQPAKAEKLKMVSVDGGDLGSLTVALCALGVRKGANGQPELLVYGKDKQPLLHVALMSVSGPAKEDPIEVSAQPQGDGAVVTLKILGKYTADIPLALSE